MALSTVPTCDVCGKAKGATNAWFVVFLDKYIPRFGQCHYAVFDWENKLASKKGAKHICGESCLTVMQARKVSRETK